MNQLCKHVHLNLNANVTLQFKAPNADCIAFKEITGERLWYLSWKCAHETVTSALTPNSSDGSGLINFKLYKQKLTECSNRLMTTGVETFAAWFHRCLVKPVYLFTHMWHHLYHLCLKCLKIHNTQNLLILLLILIILLLDLHGP